MEREGAQPYVHPTAPSALVTSGAFAFAGDLVVK